MPKGLHEFEDIKSRLEQVLEASVADETEVVWFERRHACVRRSGVCAADPPLLSVLVRVIEGRRLGWYRADTVQANELESALRYALAVAKLEPPLEKRPVFAKKTGALGLAKGVELFDPAIEALDAPSALAFLNQLGSADTDGLLRWSVSHLAVANNHGVRCYTSVTDASLDVSMGAHPGAGHAAGSSRTLAGLAPETIFERARAVSCDRDADEAGDSSSTRGHALLAPEVVIQLLDLMNAHAFAGRAFLDGSSFLSKHRNVQVFDRRVHLRDDGTSSGGLPFPFDFEGAAKRPWELIAAGTPSTPALNRHQGQLTGLRSTGQAIGGNDSFFGHLFMQPGEDGDDALLVAAGDGIFIDWIDSAVCIDAEHLRIRANARGVRRIEGGRLGRALPDQVWEGSLLRLLARLEAVGSQVIVRTTPTTPLGAISAPAVVVTETGSLVPVP